MPAGGTRANATVTADDVIEANAIVSHRAVEVWLSESKALVPVNRRMLLALHDANVPPPLIDLDGRARLSEAIRSEALIRFRWVVWLVRIIFRRRGVGIALRSDVRSVRVLLFAVRIVPPVRGSVALSCSAGMSPFLPAAVMASRRNRAAPESSMDRDTRVSSRGSRRLSPDEPAAIRERIRQVLVRIHLRVGHRPTRAAAALRPRAIPVAAAVAGQTAVPR